MSDNIYQAPNSELSENENTNKELEYAGFWVRTAASIIDSILVLLLTWPLLTLIYGFDYWTSESFYHGTGELVVSYVLPAVAVIIFWIYLSATPGKIVMGLKVISLGEQQKLSVGQSIGRYLGYFPSMIVLFIGFFWVAFDRRKQGWHDKIANTAVIKNR